MQTKANNTQVWVRLTLDVNYTLNGVSAESMAAQLQSMVRHAVSEGLLTGESPAFVNEYAMETQACSDPMTEDELATFMEQRLADGEWDMEDIPVRLARFGLMDSVKFNAEMRERLDLRAEEVCHA